MFRLPIHPLWLLIAAFLGYALMMRTNPIGANLRDGLRAVRRYSSLWGILAVCGVGYAMFDLAVRFSLSRVLPEEVRPTFQWLRSGSIEKLEWSSVWELAPAELRHAAGESLLPALSSTAGIFNNLVSTFPIAAIGAFLLLVNWQGHQGVLFRALRRRFRWRGSVAHAAILLCALAAFAKPIMYALPWYVDGDLWYRWAPVLEWLAFLFEYLLGVGIQVYLILLAYCWVRGITFTPQHLVDFAIRRFSLVIRWALVVMVLSSVLINLPLILKNFDEIAGLLNQDPVALERWVVDEWLIAARAFLAGIFIAFSTVQITLTFHSESLRRALGDHFRFLVRHWWKVTWFLLVALVHFYLLHFLNALLWVALGEGTALWVLWRLLFPLLAAFVGAWLLASWVIVYRHATARRAGQEEWIGY